MEFDEQLELGHFTLSERKCRVCGVMKDLIDGYYLIRKNKNIKSSYSYDKSISNRVGFSNRTRSRLKHYILGPNKSDFLPKTTYTY